MNQIGNFYFESLSKTDRAFGERKVKKFANLYRRATKTIKDKRVANLLDTYNDRYGFYLRDLRQKKGAEALFESNRRGDSNQDADGSGAGEKRAEGVLGFRMSVDYNISSADRLALALVHELSHFLTWSNAPYKAGANTAMSYLPEDTNIDPEDISKTLWASKFLTPKAVLTLDFVSRLDFEFVGVAPDARLIVGLKHWKEMTAEILSLGAVYGIDYLHYEWAKELYRDLSGFLPHSIRKF